MKIKITKKFWNGYEWENEMDVAIVQCDNVQRALEMYEDRCDHNEELFYRFIENDKG